MNEPSRTTKFGPQKAGDASPVLPVSFFADLTREEYIAFEMTRAREAGGLRSWPLQLLFTFSSAAVLLAVVVMEFLSGGGVDAMTAGLGLLLLLLGVRTAFQPRRVVRHAEQVYDASVASGKTFRGTVSITPELLEKAGDGETSIVRFASPHALYMETADMIVLFGSDNGLAIVLPARLMTPEVTDALHTAALAYIPTERCRIRQLLCPQAETLIPAEADTDGSAADAAEDEETVNMTVRYTPDEFFSMLRDGAYRGFVNRLPQIFALALASAVLWGWMYGLRGGVIVFILLAVALFLVNTVGVTLRARRRVREMSDGDLTVRLRFNRLGITGDRGLFLAWNAIRHAIDRPDCLEFYNERLFIRVPKRCVEDLEAIRRIADRYMRGRGRTPAD